MTRHPPCWTWPGFLPGLFLSDRPFLRRPVNRCAARGRLMAARPQGLLPTAAGQAGLLAIADHCAMRPCRTRADWRRRRSAVVVKQSRSDAPIRQSGHRAARSPDIVICILTSLLDLGPVLLSPGLSFVRRRGLPLSCRAWHPRLSARSRGDRDAFHPCHLEHQFGPAA
jgi:hypothetical protein